MWIKNILMAIPNTMLFYLYCSTNKEKRNEFILKKEVMYFVGIYPIIFTLALPFFLPENHIGWSFLGIPFFIVNFLFTNKVLGEAIKYNNNKEATKSELEKENKKLKERVEYLTDMASRAVDKIRRLEDLNESKNEYIRVLEKEYEKLKKQQQEEEWEEYNDWQWGSGYNSSGSNRSSSVDRNKENAIKLMGLSSSPTIEEVKKAYRRLSKVHHPDMGGTQNNFIKLQKAYDYMMSIL